jgi:xanthine dehydrogenase accessory factor
VKKIIDEAVNLLEKNEDFVIASVITQSGSSPRGAGAEMIIRENGMTYDTVGGGMVEEVERLAAELFNNKKALIKEFSLSGSETAEMDMICGGSVVVYLHLINADNPKYLNTYKAYQDLLEKEQKGWFLYNST